MSTVPAVVSTASRAQADNAAFRAMLDSPGSITEIFPDQVGDIDIDEFHRKFEIVCRGYGNLRRYHNKTKVLLGRALLCIQRRPILYKQRGFASFEDFLLDAETRFGVSRAELFKTKSLAENLPDITLEQAADIGVTKLYKVSKVMEQGSLDAPSRADLMEKAKSLTLKQFDQHLEDKAHLEKGDTVCASIIVHTTVTVKRVWETFANNPKIQAYCGSQKPGAILLCLIEECMGEWMAQAHQGQPQEEEPECPPPAVQES